MKLMFTSWALAIAATARLAFQNGGWNLQEGIPFTLALTGCENGCTVTLMKGLYTDLEDYKVLTNNLTSNSFTFTLESLPSSDYALKLESNDTGETKYTSRFHYKPSDLGGSSRVSKRALIPTFREGQGPILETYIDYSIEPTMALRPTSSVVNPSGSATPTSQTKHSLSAGAAAGIAASVIAAVIVILTAIFCLWRKRRENQPKQGSRTLGSTENGHAAKQPIAELDAMKSILTNGTLTSSTKMQETQMVSRPLRLSNRHESVEESIAESNTERISEAIPAELPAQQNSAISEHSPGAVTGEITTGQPPVGTNKPDTPRKPAIDSNKTAGASTEVSEWIHSTAADINHSTSQTMQAENTEIRASLLEQFSQLEGQRQRLLELHRIEQEQADLQKRLRELPDSGKG